MSQDLTNSTIESELLVISQAAKLITHASNPMPAIEGILRLLSELVGLNRGRVVLPSEKSGELSIFYSYGLTKQERIKGSYVIGEGITGKVYQSAQVALIQDIDNEPVYLTRAVDRINLPEEAVAFLAVPIMIEAQLFNGIGFNIHAYTQDYDISILLSEDDFATSTTILSGYTITAPSSGASEWVEKAASKPMYLKPDTTYKFRVLFHNAVDPGAVYWDDFHVSMGVCRDFSDAPTSSYGVAAHYLPRTNTHYLGSSAPDAEAYAHDGGDSGVGADGDDLAGTTPDDEGAVVIPTLEQGESVVISATVTGSNGYLQGWIDWNADGDFDDAGEQVAQDLAASTGTVSIPVTVPATAVSGDSYARFRYGTQTGTGATGTVNDGEVEDHAVTITGARCLAFTNEVTEAGMPISSQLKTNDKVFIPSRDVATTTGHLRAYTIDANGVPSSTAVWDAASPSKMIDRSIRLYSTDPSGSLTLFNALATPDATIRTYTLNAVLGSISRGNSLEILSNDMDTSLYLYDTDYRTYYDSTVSKRSQRVLMTSDDGFLYAVDYDTGELIWGWMPNSITAELTGTNSYQAKQLMSGTTEIVDLKDSAGTYATYIVGSYKSGLGHYVLKLDSSGNLDSVVWDQDQSGSFEKSPNNGEMEFFRDASGVVYATYVLTNNSSTSTVAIRSLTSSTISLDIGLNYEVTSTPFIMQDYGKTNAPAKKTLYLGTTTGNIHTAMLLTAGGVLDSSANIKTGLENTAVASMDDAVTDAITHIGPSVVGDNNRYYLSTQTASRLTIHKYNSSTTSWNKTWTSYSTGAGSWDASGIYMADTSGVPTNEGGFNIIPPTTGIQSLPTDATITGRAVIVANTVVLPLTALPASSGTCYGKGYYYMYRLDDGNFPTSTFFKSGGTVIEKNIALGYGEATEMAIGNLRGKDELLGYGYSDQKTDLSTGTASPFIIKDSMNTGIRSWSEIGR